MGWPIIFWWWEPRSVQYKIMTRPYSSVRQYLTTRLFLRERQQLRRASAQGSIGKSGKMVVKVHPGLFFLARGNAPSRKFFSRRKFELNWTALVAFRCIEWISAQSLGIQRSDHGFKMIIFVHTEQFCARSNNQEMNQYRSCLSIPTRRNSDQGSKIVHHPCEQSLQSSVIVLNSWEVFRKDKIEIGLMSVDGDI